MYTFCIRLLVPVVAAATVAASCSTALSAGPTSTVPLALDAAGARVRGLLRSRTLALPSAPLALSWIAGRLPVFCCCFYACCRCLWVGLRAEETRWRPLEDYCPVAWLPPGHIRAKSPSRIGRSLTDHDHSAGTRWPRFYHMGHPVNYFRPPKLRDVSPILKQHQLHQF